MTSIRRTPLHAATVTAVTELTPRMRRITVAAPSLVGVAINPAQDVELVLAEPSGRRVKRRYTIRFARPAIGEFDLDVLLHEDGPGSEWGAAANVDTPVSFFGPRGRLLLTDCDWNLFVGDESSLPAIASLIEAMPAGTRAVAFIEVESIADEMAMAIPDGVEADIRWVHRGDTAAGTPDGLAPHLDALTPRPGNGHAYLLGESRTVVALRAHLARHNLTSDQIFTKGYWNLAPRRA